MVAPCGEGSRWVGHHGNRSHYFGAIGVIVWLAAIAAPLIYVHGFWLPRNGVSGWTGEPREKYYALRGWPPPES